MEENTALKNQLLQLTEEIKETKANTEKLMQENDKLEDLYVFFHTEGKNKNCEKCEKTRYEINHLCDEAQNIEYRIKELKSIKINLEKVLEKFPDRFRELTKEKQRIHKDSLWHIGFVEEDYCDKGILNSYIIEEVRDKEFSKAKAEKKKLRRRKRILGVWDRKKDLMYNSSSDSDEETKARKVLEAKKNKREEEYFSDEWEYYNDISEEEEEDTDYEKLKVKVKLHYEHQRQTISDDGEEVMLPDWATGLKSKFAAQKLQAARARKNDT